MSSDAAANSLIYGTIWASPVISYSFPQAGISSFAPAYPNFASSFAGLSAIQQGAARTVLSAWSNVANIQFTELADNSGVVGDIRIGYSFSPDMSGAAGLSYVPGSYGAALDAVAGDIWLNPSANEVVAGYRAGTLLGSGFAAGSWGYFTLLHEVGHALGFKHPFEAVATNPAVLSASLDSAENTVMSYTTVANDPAAILFTYNPTTPMPLDIVAIQAMYGANSNFNAGDTVYSFNDNAGQFYFETIWDGGGVDTLAAIGSTAAVINLNEAVGSRIGNAVNACDSAGNNLRTVDNIQIAYGVVIENATGGSGNDTLTGNGVGNVLTGSAGNDSLDGGLGVDIAAYAGARSGFSIAGTAAGFSLSDATGAEGVDTLVGIERLRFADGNVALDLNGNAGITAKILGAVFGAPAVANAQFVGIGLGHLDAGMSYEALCELAIAAAGATTHAAIVNLLWNNVARAPIDPVNESRYVGLLAGGMTVGALAVVAADSAENAANIGLVGLAATGIEYVAVA